MALRAAQAVNDALLNCCCDLCTQHALQLLLSHDHGIVHQVPDNLIHIAPMEPDLSKFRGLHLSRRQMKYSAPHDQNRPQPATFWHQV